MGEVTVGNKLKRFFKRCKVYSKGKVFFPFILNDYFRITRKKDMSEKQINCTYSILTQYLCSLTLGKLRKKYKKHIVKLVSDINSSYDNLPHEHSNKIWACWLQGFSSAPDLVKICYQSLLDNFSDTHEIIEITETNFTDYVQIPDYIIQKFKKGFITRTHLSDLIRLELLIKYGGTWIDSTVLFTGKKLPDYMFDSELFMFQSIGPQLFGRATSSESWFITSIQNHKILLLTRELLYLYWKEYNVLIDYWLIYDFVELAIEQFEDEWRKVIPFGQTDIHILQERMLWPFDKNVFDSMVNRVGMQKLNWKLDENQLKIEGTYYHYLITHFKMYNPSIIQK